MPSVGECEKSSQKSSLLHTNSRTPFVSELLVVVEASDDNTNNESGTHEHVNDLETYLSQIENEGYCTEHSEEGFLEYEPAAQYKSRPVENFITGSSYEGEWSKIGMEQFGTYTFIHGVVYKGQMMDGMFHGEGTLTYPLGQTLLGIYKKGKLVKWNFITSDTKTNEVTAYCRPPDRRFMYTVDGDFNAAPKEILTNSQPTRDIPKGCYDVGDGFFNPQTDWVHMASDMTKLNYMPPKNFQEVDVNIYLPDGSLLVKKIPFVPILKPVPWIIDQCRKQWDEVTGYKPQLYEYWFSGKKEEKKKLNMKTVDMGGRFPKDKSINEILLGFFERISWSDELSN